MEQKKTRQDASDNPHHRHLRPIPGGRQVDPLTDQEVLALRQLLKDAEALMTGCPVAARILSKR